MNGARRFSSGSWGDTEECGEWGGPTCWAQTPTELGNATARWNANTGAGEVIFELRGPVPGWRFDHESQQRDGTVEGHWMADERSLEFVELGEHAFDLVEGTWVYRQHVAFGSLQRHALLEAQIRHVTIALSTDPEARRSLPVDAPAVAPLGAPCDVRGAWTVCEEDAVCTRRCIPCDAVPLDVALDEVTVVEDSAEQELYWIAAPLCEGALPRRHGRIPRIMVDSFQFTAPAAGDYEVSYQSLAPGTNGLYISDRCDPALSVEPVACVEDGASHRITLEAGATVFLNVEDPFDSRPNEYRLTISPQP